jgi:hypothetical protein
MRRRKGYERKIIAPHTKKGVFYLSMISAVKQANWFHISADVHATL